MSISKTFTVRQAASFLQIAASTVRRFAGEGRLAGAKDQDGRWCFRVADLELFRADCAANHLEKLPIGDRITDQRSIGFVVSRGAAATRLMVSDKPVRHHVSVSSRWARLIPSGVCVLTCLIFLILRQFDFYNSKGFSWGLSLFCAVLGELFVLYLSYVSGSFSFKKLESWLLMGVVWYLGFVLCYNVVMQNYHLEAMSNKAAGSMGLHRKQLIEAQSEYDKALFARDADMERVNKARSEKDRVYLRKLMNRSYGSEILLHAAKTDLRASESRLITAPAAVVSGFSGWLLAVFSVLVLLVNIVAIRNLSEEVRGRV
jgi:hypothetical protein